MWSQEGWSQKRGGVGGPRVEEVNKKVGEKSDTTKMKRRNNFIKGQEVFF